MNPTRLLLTATLALVLLTAPACLPFLKKRTKELPPTTIPPAPPPKREKVEAPKPPEIEPAPAPADQTPPPSVEAQSVPQVTPPPPKRRGGKGKPRVRQATAAEERTASVPPAETPPSAPQPRLGEILSPEELREHAENFDRSLRETRAMLAQILKHKLTAEQSQTAARIQTFLHQAQEAHRTDLVAAVNLARRAELLAKDLLRQFP